MSPFLVIPHQASQSNGSECKLAKTQPNLTLVNIYSHNASVYTSESLLESQGNAIVDFILLLERMEVYPTGTTSPGNEKRLQKRWRFFSEEEKDLSLLII